MSYLHCKIQYGVAQILSIYESVIPADTGTTFRTGDITLPPQQTQPDLPWVYTGTQSEGSVDGTIEQDFKAPKVSEILRRSTALLSGGAVHSGHEFAAGDDVVDLLAGMDIAVDPFIQDVSGSYYEAQNIGSLTMLKAAVKDRRVLVLDATAASGGEGDLINDVTSAANTEVAMNGIVDLRV